MSLKERIQEDLCINDSYFKTISDRQAVCLVHSTWLQYLQTKKEIHQNFLDFGSLNNVNRQMLLDCSDSSPPMPWKQIIIYAVPKNDGDVQSLAKISSKASTASVDLNYFQLIHYVTETNYRNLWKQAWRKYCSSSRNLKNKSLDLQGYNDAIREVLQRLYGCPIIKKGSFHSNPSHCSTPQPSSPKDTVHPNLVQVICAVESDNFFYLLYNQPKYTLFHCIMFSPAVLELSTVHQLFVVYQLLQVLRAVHNCGLYIGPITLSDIFVKQNLWIQVMPCIWDDLLKEASEPNSEINTSNMSIDASKLSVSHEKGTRISVKHCTSNSVKCSSDKNQEMLSCLTASWVKGALSNFDYLMELNKLAGRVKDDPHCHPVVPWIMNFNSPEGGWRDLSKSKFRLNKGDKQLDLLYESASHHSICTAHGSVTNVAQDSALTVPHHTSDVLSDITYYVYKARRMPKSVLCQHVRQKWVPAEYPSTMERLQEWTPDECIPEFFSDPTIFYSIHPDLHDLGVPNWCKDPEDFIKKHRAALESDHVSERLHYWIDLTFGYRLSGNAAVKSKNVCLPLVDHHKNIRSHGMVQLFTHPHPHKFSSSLYFGATAPKTFRNTATRLQDAKDSADDETSSESSGKVGRWKVLRSKSVPANSDLTRVEPRPENQTIVLPKDYSPLAALKQLESVYTFISRSQGGKIPDDAPATSKTSSTSTQHLQNRDMLVLGCLISEVALASRLKPFFNNQSLEERYAMSLLSLKNNRQEIPKCFQQVIPLLLHLTQSLEKDPNQNEIKSSVLPDRYPPVSGIGLPPPSAHQLLQPLIHVIPFPTYFSKFYMFLQKLNHYSEKLEAVILLDIQKTVKSSLISKLAMTKVHFAAEELQGLLPQLNSEAVELLSPYLQEMFENSHTAVLATWHLFNTVSQCLGPQQTLQKLLKPLIKVFDAEVPSSKHMKLYHRSFLLQLIIRLGLNAFLIHFKTILIEAVGGSKDFFPLNTKFEEEEIIESTDGNVKSKAVHLTSEDLNETAVEDSDKLNILSTENVFWKEDDSSNLNPELLEDVDSGKDPEIFDFDDASEESVKVPKDADTVEKDDLSPSVATHLNVPDEKKWVSDDDVDEPSGEADAERFSACIDDAEENEPDIVDVLSSPVSESKKAKMSAYSQSAPNLSCPLSQYKSSSNFKQMDKSSASDTEDKEISNSPLNFSDSKLKDGFNLSDVASESVLWLAHRLGPVLTARCLTRNLLRMLTLCYDGPEKREIIHDSPQTSDMKNCISISNRWYTGDKYASKVVDCLSRVAALYGEQFIMLQYLPHIADLLSLCKKKVVPTLESGLFGAMALLQHIMPYISDAVLMDHLQDVIIKDVLYLVIRLISSLRITFPSGGQSRWIITCRLIDIIYIIGLRIGFEMTRKHLSNILQRFFSCFDKVYDQKGSYKSLDDISSSGTPGSSPVKEKALEEMRQTFTAEMAYLSYVPFCKLAGSIYMENTLKNEELIRNLCMQHDLNVISSESNLETSNSNINNPQSDNVSVISKGHQREPSLGQDESFVSGVFGKNVMVVGNRLDVQLGDESNLVTTVGQPIPDVKSSNTSKIPDVPKYDISLLRRKMDNTQRHLKGNWLAYWEHETGRSEKDHHFNFKQIKLQSFIGHTGAIRTIQVLDNENSFLTSSKDKTVKLWSLRSCGDGTAQTPSQWTYTQHRKSVFAVSFLDSLRLVGSCDSTVHIWDPFMGSCIKQLESTKGSPVTVLISMPAPSSTFLAATTNSTVRFLDARTCKYMHEFKVSIGSAGLIRCLAVSPSSYWLAVGHSTGMISVLDVRTGLLFGTWMGHEGEILQLKAFNNSHFVTSSLDNSVSVWNSDDSQAKCNLRGPMEPVTSLCFYKSEVISGTTGNKIGVHSSIDRKAIYSHTRLRSDTFKGMLTAMALLPLNRLLLIGADNGNVVLLS